MISGFILILVVLCVKNIEDETKKIKMFWILFITFTVIFALLSRDSK